MENILNPGFYFLFRNGASLKTMPGESSHVTPDMTASWNDTSLPTLLSNYSLENICNADEFGLFFQCLPNKSIHIKSEKCSGGKHIKIRITGLAVAKAVGEKLPMFVIGKAKNPRCFKYIHTLPCRYWSQKKSWMDSELFEEWVRELNAELKAKELKVLLIIDNCVAYPEIENLSHVKLIFLPPSATSVIQPMDQGFIRSLKSHYRKRIVRVILTHLDQVKPIPKVSFLLAMQLVFSAWNDVSKEAVINCFRKANIFEKYQMNAVNDFDDPFKELDESLKDLQTKESYLVAENMTVKDVAEADDQVMTSAPFLTNELILKDVSAMDEGDKTNDLADDGDDVDKEVKAPSSKKVKHFLETLKNYSLLKKNRGRQMIDIIFNFENLVIEKSENYKQSTIDDFFSKNSKNIPLL